MPFKSDSSLKTSKERIEKNRKELAKRIAQSKVNSAKGHLEKLPSIHEAQMKKAKENAKKAEAELKALK